MEAKLVAGSRPLARPSIPIMLVYGSRVCLSLDIVSAEGTPVDVGAMGLDRWSVSLVQSLGTSSPELARADIPEDIATGSRLDVTLDLSSAELFRAVTGSDAGVRCLLCVYGRHEGADVDSFSMHVPVSVEGRCERHAPIDLSTALMRELQHGAAEGRALSRQVAEAIVTLSDIREDTMGAASEAAAEAAEAVRDDLGGLVSRAETAAATATEQASQAIVSASEASTSAAQAASEASESATSASEAATSATAAASAAATASAHSASASMSAADAAANAATATSAADRAAESAVQAATASGEVSVQVSRAESAADAAATSASDAATSAASAESSVSSAEAARDAAAGHAAAALASREGAALSEASAESAASLAADHATAAEEAATASAASASASAGSAAEAAQSSQGATDAASSAASAAATAAADVTAQFGDAVGQVNAAVSSASASATAAGEAADRAAGYAVETYGRDVIDAMVGAGLDVSFSADGEEWHYPQTEDDTMFRVRSLGVADAAWSAPIALPRGPKGVPGATGVSPLVKVEHQDGATIITVTDRDGTTTSTIQDGVTDAYTRAEVDAKLSAVYRYRGTVGSYAELPTEGNEVGDTWNVSAEDEEHLLKAGDNVAWTADGTWDALSGQVDLTPFARKAEAATDHNHDEQYLKLTGGTVTGTVYATSVNAVDSLSEGGVKLSDKYAAKSHTHKVADVTGLQAALDAKADADAVPASAVTYAETLPTASENAPGCVIVTGASSETQTRGHVYALANVERTLATSLSVSFANDVFSADTFLVYGSGSYHDSLGTLHEYDLAWISTTTASGTNVGQFTLFKNKTSDTRWYLLNMSGDSLWRCTDDRCLDIGDPTALSGMEFRHPEGATTSLSITAAGAGGSVIDFTYGGTVVPMYQVADYNGKPKWLGKSTEGGMATQSLYFDGAPGWRYRNTSEYTPANMTWNGQVDSLIGASGMEWYDSAAGMGYAVTVTEKPLPSVASRSYEDITVAELDALRSAVAALEARVAALGG